MAVTASGEILGCGQNDEGQVRPDLLTEAFLPRPSLVEPVLSHRITQARRLERWDWLLLGVVPSRARACVFEDNRWVPSEHRPDGVKMTVS